MESVDATVQTPPAGGKRLQKSSSHTGLWITAGVVGALATAYIGLCAWAGHAPALYPGLTSGGVDLGDMTREQATTALLEAPALPDSTAMTLTLTDGDGEPLPDAFILTYADLGGVERQAAAAAENAWDYCHGGSFFARGWRYVKSLLGRADLPTPLEAPGLSARIEGLAEEISTPAISADYRLGAQSLDVTVPRDGFAVYPNPLEAAITDSLSQSAPSVTCPAAILGGGDALTAQSLAATLSGQMKNAGYDAETDTIIPEQPSARFDVDYAQTRLDGAAPGSTVTIPAAVEQPEVTAEVLKEVLFRDLLGECRTHVGGSKGRKHNVELASAAFNGKVLADGEVFSYNETVGKRTVEKGYSEAPAYLKGETVMEVGGGVCQPSSTLYLACLRADLEITERYAHRYVPAYIPAGMDATVSWGGPDYKFTNNTGYPIRLETVYEKGYLTVRIWGTNLDGTSVKVTNQWLSTTPFEVVYEEDPELAPGTEEVRVTPYTGHKYKTYRNRYDKDGKLISSTYEATSDYKARNKTIARGPLVTPPATGPDPQLPVEPTVPAVPGGPEETPIVPIAPVPPTTEPEEGGWADLPVITPVEPIPDSGDGLYPPLEF